MNRVYNYSAGPSMLPVEVLEQAQKEMLCYGDSGMSVMEMSHRSEAFKKIAADAEANLRELMNIPNNLPQLLLVNKNLQFNPFMESLPAIYIRAETNTVTIIFFQKS